MASPGTICLAVYRPNLDLLKIQIESIRHQTLDDWSCLVGIDGRDESTAAYLTELVTDDMRFSVVMHEENVGFYKNFERILRDVDPGTSWVALADQDDYWYPHKLEVLVDALRSDPICSAAFGQAKVVDEHGRSSGVTDRRYRSVVDLIFNNVVTGSFSVLRPDVLLYALPFPEPTDVAYHDHWLGVCAALVGRIEVVNAPLQDYVQHGANVVGEAHPSSVNKRWNQVGSTTSSLVQRLQYLAEHRWGWRITLARLATDRCGDKQRQSAQTQKDVRIIARGRPSWRLSYLIVRSVTRRATPPSRGLSHLAGMLLTRKKCTQ